MPRLRSRQAETEDINQRRLRRGAVHRQHLSRWAVGKDELAPGVVGDVHLHPTTLQVINNAAAGAAQLLVMSATGDSIASGGDHVAFNTIEDRLGFDLTTTAGDEWVHPVSGVYVLTYEHAWESFTGGGTIVVEVGGLATEATVLASGSSGGRGHKTISYQAAEGQTGKIKITQASGSPQTCDATVWVSLPDPSRGSAAANVILFIDGDQVAAASGDIPSDFSSATLLVGEWAHAPAASSSFFYDDAEVVTAGSNLLGNAGFESALASTGTDRAVITGNWRAYDPGGATLQRQGTTVRTASFAGQVDGAAGANGGGYFLQDVDVGPGDAFEIRMWVRRSSGTQLVGIVFDWDRSSGGTYSAYISVGASETSFEAFGLTGAAAAVPADEWHEVTLRVTP